MTSFVVTGLVAVCTPPDMLVICAAANPQLKLAKIQSTANGKLRINFTPRSS
jgi:hypothetical protein